MMIMMIDAPSEGLREVAAFVGLCRIIGGAWRVSVVLSYILKGQRVKYPKNGIKNVQLTKPEMLNFVLLCCVVLLKVIGEHRVLLKVLRRVVDAK